MKKLWNEFKLPQKVGIVGFAIALGVFVARALELGDTLVFGL